MNQETEKNINEAINWLQETGASVQDFAIEQAPLYCREVVAWELWGGAVGTSIGLLFLGVGVLALVLFTKWMRIDEMEPNARTLPSLMVALVGIAAGIATMSEHLPKTIRAAVAPRLVVVEHLRGLKNP